MRTILYSLGGLLLVGVTLLIGIRNSESVQAGVADATQPVRPVIVELFTSEGCSSCPPADALLAKLDQQKRLGNAEIIALEEHVDYWDHLGWRDPFSSPQFTQRQEDYSTAFRTESVYTPQMVVDGRAEFVGSSQSNARNAISDASRLEKAEITLSKVQSTGSTAHLKIDVTMLPSAAAHEAQVWLAVTESELHSNVKHGENAGEDLHHAAVVRNLRKVANAKLSDAIAYSGEQDVALESSWKKQDIRLVVFVQDPKSRHILGAASTHLAQ
jgi:hypothetical protein